MAKNFNTEFFTNGKLNRQKINDSVVDKNIYISVCKHEFLGIRPLFDVYENQEMINKFCKNDIEENWNGNLLGLCSALVSSNINFFISDLSLQLNSGVEKLDVMIIIMDPEKKKVLSSVVIDPFSLEDSYLGNSEQKPFTDLVIKQFNAAKYCVKVDQDKLEEFNDKSPIYTEHMIFDRKIPIIDASHSLYKGLSNVEIGKSIYTDNFMISIANMLSNSEIASKVIEIAKQIDKKPEDMDLQRKLSEIFKEDLKQYLPYYNEKVGLLGEFTVNEIHKSQSSKETIAYCHIS